MFQIRSRYTDLLTGDYGPEDQTSRIFYINLSAIPPVKPENLDINVYHFLLLLAAKDYDSFVNKVGEVPSALVKRVSPRTATEEVSE